MCTCGVFFEHPRFENLAHTQTLDVPGSLPLLPAWVLGYNRTIWLAYRATGEPSA